MMIIENDDNDHDNDSDNSDDDENNDENNDNDGPIMLSFDVTFVESKNKSRDSCDFSSQKATDSVP